MAGRSLILGVLLAFITLCASCLNDPNVGTNYVHRCSAPDTARLCLHGDEFRLMGATTDAKRGTTGATVALAHALNRNTVEAVNFQAHYRSLSDAKSEATWTQVDQLLADAAAAKPRLHVILNLSEFAKDLAINNVNPLTDLRDWDAYIDFIANRVNSVNKVRYKNDTTLAMVVIWGEPCFVGEDDGPFSDCPGTVTRSATYNTNNMRAFYEHVMDRWHTDAPYVLVSTGGLSHLNDPDNPPGVSDGIPWRDLMAYRTNAMCDIEVNSPNDYFLSVAKVTNFCRAINKGWFLAAWSSCYRNENYAWPVMRTDDDLAAHNRLMFATMHALRGTPAAYPGVGTDFWSMHQYPIVNGVPEPGHCNQDATTFPHAAQAIKDNAS
jgi:hypothetical protein